MGGCCSAFVAACLQVRRHAEGREDTSTSTSTSASTSTSTSTTSTTTTSSTTLEIDRNHVGKYAGLVLVNSNAALPAL